MKFRQTCLPRPEKFSRSAHGEVQLGQLKSVLRPHHGVETLFRLVRTRAGQS